ncbi:acetylesterase [Macrococcus hajekii]|nr:alpha/beta hydrolase-fold protein [Macrococcus hajekii]GGA98595.1 acetylesterase [Macrococcus hajekii]
MFTRGLVTPYELASTYLKRTVKLGIYLAEDYSALHEHAVVLAFDGQDFSQLGQLHRQYQRLYDERELRRAIIIFIHYPDIETRSNDYHPESTGQNEMIQFVTSELEPFLTEHFMVSDERLAMGDSLSASLALALSLADNRYDQAALFSPMVTDTTLRAVDQLEHQVRYYQVIGNEESAFQLKNGETADFLTPNRALHQAFEEKGIEHVYHEIDGGHTWKTWKPEIASALQYFLTV